MYVLYVEWKLLCLHLHVIKSTSFRFVIVCVCVCACLCVRGRKALKSTCSEVVDYFFKCMMTKFFFCKSNIKSCYVLQLQFLKSNWISNILLMAFYFVLISDEPYMHFSPQALTFPSGQAVTFFCYSKIFSNVSIVSELGVMRKCNKPGKTQLIEIRN